MTAPGHRPPPRHLCGERCRQRDRLAAAHAVDEEGAVERERADARLSLGEVGTGQRHRHVGKASYVGRRGSRRERDRYPGSTRRSSMPLPPALAAGFAVLALVMAAVFVLGAHFAPIPHDSPTRRRRATWIAVGVAALYLGVSAALALSGVLADVEARPPPAALLLGALGVGIVALAFSRLGDRLLAWPIGVLVGVQAFRILVELLLAAAHHAGSVPVEMTYEGRNVDIVTGLLAAGIGLWGWRGAAPRALIAVWNALGLVLLIVVVGIAATSAFGIVETSPRVTLPATWPGVWLPAWLVQLALFGHVLVFRALARRGERQS